MRLAWLALILISGCNAPGAEMRGAPVQRVEVAGFAYDVRQNGPHIQAIRRNLAGFPKIREVAATAEAAMEQVSGCEVAWLMGDVAVMWGGLSCNGEKPPKQPTKSGPDVYYCDVRRGGGPTVLDCAR